MKPVSYQNMASTVNVGHQILGLDHLLSTSKVKYCEKCGFASRDSEIFKKHTMEHMGTRFYCFYCNNVSFSKAELNVHLKQHTSNYPFKCQHCGHGYMRRLCLVKHIERLHSKVNGQGPTTPAITKSAHVPVSSPFPSVPSADSSTVRPAVKVTIPTPITPAARLGKEQKLGDIVDLNAAKGDAELVPHVNGHILHNRALTVSLPEEVTIPAGCMVELIEVKTVNGTKELKLRFVSQQEKDSAIKDTRAAATQNTALGKPLSSTVNNPNMKSTHMGICTVNKNQHETKSLNVERPAGVSVNISQNPPDQASKEKIGTKRTSQEMTNFKLEKIIPTKVLKQIHNPIREGNCGIQITHKDIVNHNSVPSASTKIANWLPGTRNPENTGMCVSQRPVDGRMNFIPEHSMSVPQRRVCEMKNTPQNVQVALKKERRETSTNNSAVSIRKEAVGLNQQCLKSASPSSGQLGANVQGRSSSLYTCKDNVATNPSYPMPGVARRTPSEPSPVKQLMVEGGSGLSNSKFSPWTQEVKSKNRTVVGDVSKPEGFPVISSVFSLSQQLEVVQGSMQPLVMALRGIVMNKPNSPDETSSQPDHVKTTDTKMEPKEEKPELGYCAQVEVKDDSTHDQLLKELKSDSVKVEESVNNAQSINTQTENHAAVKEERPQVSGEISSASLAAEIKSSTVQQEAVSTTDPQRDADLSPQSFEKTEHNIGSRVLTVSLKRIQVDSWKTSKRRLKLRISKCKPQVLTDSLTDCIIHPMPLKVDQLVKRPGPNQPVVVLNHPKPQIPKGGEGATTSVAPVGASDVVPKCQILKMRLSKVMGQKYEVMGCTVGVFP